MARLIGDIILNRKQRYEGDLRDYFKIAFYQNRGGINPYHNVRHILHVLWLCDDAISYYTPPGLGPQNCRNLLIAAMFHDFDHSGRMGHDDLEIERAVRGLKAHLQPMDQDQIQEITTLIKATEFPHNSDLGDLSLEAKILRDADLAQCLDNAWIQQVLFGLGLEANLPIAVVLGRQKKFLSNLSFETRWAQDRFPRERIEDKIREVNDLISCLF